MFYLKSEVKFIIIVIKVLDYFLLGGFEDKKLLFISELKKPYQFGIITHLPGTFLFFGLNIHQDELKNVTSDAETKLEQISRDTVSRARRGVDELLNCIQSTNSNSINGSIGFIGQNDSTLACCYNSYLQQKRSNTKVSHIVKQNNSLKHWKRTGTTVSYCSPPISSVFVLYICSLTLRVQANTVSWVPSVAL